MILFLNILFNLNPRVSHSFLLSHIWFGLSEIVFNMERVPTSKETQTRESPQGERKSLELSDGLATRSSVIVALEAGVHNLVRWPPSLLSKPNKG
jgi:hypothetical protein